MDKKQFLKITLFTPGLNGRWGLPVLFEGKPGVGKSAVIEKTSAQLGLYCKTLIASIREPSDFGGLPVPVEVGNKRYMEYLSPGWASDVEIEGDSRGLIFLDEISTSPPSVQAALLRLILDGALGDYKFPNGVRFMAASNAVSDAAGGWDLAPPLANRFGHVGWDTPEVDQWCGWLIGSHAEEGNISPEESQNAEQIENAIMEQWPAAFAKAKGLIAGFIKAKPGNLFAMPDMGSQNRSKAWPSPRSWAMATRVIAGAAVHRASELLTDELIAAFVGAGAASELITYKRNFDLPDPEDILDGKVKFKHKAKRLDRTMAVLSSCTALVASPTCKARDKRIDKLWTIMSSISDEAIDVTVPSAKILIESKLHFPLNGKPQFRDASRILLGKLQPILTEAGIRT
jgi:hypothetical protein